ncbi:hypothetical protein HMPREF0973_02504 [Prevotella veroralis F0319]|uniref:Uncharacterized protein n=1 Tax=Prevotella veroralis F0319 TaxID=649761 RepID=C9MS90_9BACT|nr:hypothetical protein HMPREF0973_02504 [Prevotella veroralis F0319]
MQIFTWNIYQFWENSLPMGKISYLNQLTHYKDHSDKRKHI